MNRLTDILSLEDNFVVVSPNYKIYFGGAFRNQNVKTTDTSLNVITFQFPKEATFITYAILKIPYPEHLNGTKKLFQVPISTQNSFLVKNMENNKEILNPK